MKHSVCHAARGACSGQRGNRGCFLPLQRKQRTGHTLPHTADPGRLPWAAHIRSRRFFKQLSQGYAHHGIRAAHARPGNGFACTNRFPAISRASLPCLKPLPPNGASGTGSSVPICPAAATGWNASSRQVGSAFALRMMTSSRSFLPTTAAPDTSPCVLNRLSPFKCTIQSLWQTCSVEFVTALKFCAEAGRA